MWTYIYIYIYTYTRHMHKYRVDMYKICNGVNNNNNNNKKDKTKTVRTKIYKQMKWCLRTDTYLCQRDQEVSEGFDLIAPHELHQFVACPRRCTYNKWHLISNVPTEYETILILATSKRHYISLIWNHRIVWNSAKLFSNATTMVQDLQTLIQSK